MYLTSGMLAVIVLNTDTPPPPPPPKNDPIYYVINRCYFILDGIHSWAQLSPFNTTWAYRIITGWTRPGMCSRLEVWTLLDKLATFLGPV